MREFTAGAYALKPRVLFCPRGRIGAYSIRFRSVDDALNAIEHNERAPSFYTTQAGRELRPMIDSAGGWLDASTPLLAYQMRPVAAAIERK